MNYYQRFSLYNALALILHIVVSFLIQFRFVNDFTVGEISGKYPTLFTPAAITFSIWILIYVSLFVFCAYHLIMAYRNHEKSTANKKVVKTWPYFVIINLTSIAWFFAWTHEWLLISVLLITIQLIMLIILHNNLCIHDATRSMISKVCTQFPISIYFAWITVATVANCASFLKAIQWNGWGISEINWTITIIGLVVIITIWVMNRRLNVFYGLVICWALYGIILRSGESKGDFLPVIYTAYGGIALIAVHIFVAVIRNMRKPTASGNRVSH
ncbi:MAG TPA: hypothetical protein VM012_05705 [Flavitalea sp.]|nr:hypothetical protein [Flavitalea sp.]